MCINDITERLGLGTGSFYNYFKSKEAFYDQIIDRLENRGKQQIDKLIERFQSPVNKLKALYRFTTLGLKHNPILRGILLSDNRYLYPGIERRKSRQETLLSHIESLIDVVLREGLQKRTFRFGHLKNPKRLVLTIYNALLFEMHDQQNANTVEDLTDDILVLLERGLKRRLRLRKRDERLDKRSSRTGQSKQK